MAYITALDATAYFTGTLNEAAWNAILAARQELLLESAAQYIDVAFKYTGTQTDEIVAFPRLECLNTCTGLTYDDTVVPEAVKIANAEIALKMDTSTDLSAGTLYGDDFNIKEEQVGDLRVVYKDTSNASKSAQPYGFTWLKCLLANPFGAVSVRTAKG